MAGTIERCDCGKSSVVAAGGVDLCVDCYYKLQVAQTLAVRLAAINMNHAAAEMDFISGLRNFTPRIQVPDLPQAPMTFNNIKVNNSTVGAINTGNVATIDVSVTYLDQSGQKALSEALAAFAQSVVNANQINDAVRNEIMEQVTFLSEQAVASAKERKPGVVKVTIAGLAETVSKVAGSATAVAVAWEHLEPMIKLLFGFN